DKHRDRRGTYERLLPTAGCELLLLDGDESLVVDVRPAVMKAHLRGRGVGVEVDADRVVADGDVQVQSQDHDREARDYQGLPHDALVDGRVYMTEHAHPPVHDIAHVK